jgi:hypothetical protein
MNIFQELKERKVLDKDGKVDALGPYGKSKLTGQEVAQYFKKHKVKDKKIKKAVEVALDLGGAMSVAQKEIKKFFGNSVLKNKDVQKALKYANESFEMNQLVGMLHESVLNLTEKNLMPDIQKIVDTKGAAKVGGVMIDMFTASMIAQIYDKVNDQNKKKMEKAKVEMLVKIAQKMMQKMEYDPSDIVEGRAMPLKKIAKKYKREIEQLAKKGQSPEMGKHKVYMALYNLAWENGDINTDDPDQTDEVIDDYLDDMMGEFFAHIKEGFKSDAQRRAAFASGYKAKGKKDKKEEVDLEENEKGLKNKAEKSGMPLGILKQVYNRGLAAYKTGHRPGATAPQWAMARVNSFVTKSKGTWGGADKDLAAKVQGKKESVQEEVTDKDIKNIQKFEKQAGSQLSKMIKAYEKIVKSADKDTRSKMDGFTGNLYAAEDELRMIKNDLENAKVDQDTAKRKADPKNKANMARLGKKLGVNEEELAKLRSSIDEWIAADGTRRRVHEKDKRKQKGKLKETPMDSYREMWEDALLEKKELDPRAIEKIAKMTDSNNHNAAVITLSKHMKERKVENMMNLLTKMHKEMGHMTSDMIAMRRDLMKQLLDKAKKSYSNFDDLNKAF